MISLRDLLNLVSKEKRNRVKATQKFTVGMVVVVAVGVAAGILFAPRPGKEAREDLKNKTINTVETIKDTVQKNTAKVKDSVFQAAQEICNTIKYVVQRKMKGVNKDIKDGFHEINQEFIKNYQNNTGNF